jgi:peptidoglycan/xylan/chitin deacetylase (PgdA/CDA1 family)
MAHIHSKKDNNFSSERQIQIKTYILFYSCVILVNSSKQRRFPNFIFNISKVIFPLLILSILVLNIIPYRSFSVIKYNVAQNHPVACNCVIFRMDDVQDYWIEPAQIAAMNLFMSKNQSLSLGLIMNVIGNDSKIINKVGEGYQKGLFELALHGWNHVDYTKLTEQEQQYSLQKANEKMQKLFGSTSNIFIPPNDPFNNDTLKAMSRLGIQILSSVGYEDRNLNYNIFVANGNVSGHHTWSYNNVANKSSIYHIPGTILFKDYVRGVWVKTPIDKILNAVSANIEKYGYAVVVIHPQDFVKVDEKGKFTNTINESEFNDLLHLIDSVLSKNIHITSFSKLIRYGTETHSNYSTNANIKPYR